MTYLTSFLLTCSIQVTGFVFAYSLQTETFYDVLGGVNYLALAIYSFLSSSDADQEWDTRKVSITTLFVISRGWLLLFLAWRAHERKGDARFDNIKDKFALFLMVWLIQGLWCYFISMPLLFVNASTTPLQPLTLLEKTSLCGFAFGIAIEIAADVQKALWVKAGRTGGFCAVGVWKYSRHPNYFGEMLQWWCAFAYAYSSSSDGLADPIWWSCSISPLFTMQILLFMSGTGVSNAEGKSLKRYYDQWPEQYAEYRENTSVLVPMVGYRHVPLVLKRTIFLDFSRYEYKPSGKEKGQ